jgi:hypothetical protein
MVEPFPINLTATYVVSQIVLEQVFAFDVLNQTSFHCQQVVFFINLAPIDDLTEFFLEDEVEQNTSATPISFSEGVAMFIPTYYFSTISFKMDCGIL